MPDITMCSNVKCPLARECYRSELSGTRPSSWQSMSVFDTNEDGECDYFMEKKK